MPKALPIRVFKAFRFAVMFGQPEVSDAVRRLGGRMKGLAAVWSDVFVPGQIWLAKAHAEGEKTLHELVQDEATNKRLSVFFIDQEGNGARRIDVTFTGHKWHPFDLDAQKEDSAVEWLTLTGCTYEGPFDDKTA